MSAIPATKLTVLQAIERGKYMMNRVPRPHYSMPDRGSTLLSPYYDCSSFIGTCWDLPGRPGTRQMPFKYPDWGFQYFDYDTSILKRGDVIVLWAHDPLAYHAGGHTLMYLGQENGVHKCIHCTTRQTFDGIEIRSGLNFSNKVYGKCILRGRGGIEIVKWQSQDDIQDSWYKAGYINA